ncbi:MAG: PilZ domain-containing protein [Pseudomonadota bacterium]
MAMWLTTRRSAQIAAICLGIGAGGSAAAAVCDVHAAVSAVETAQLALISDSAGPEGVAALDAALRRLSAAGTGDRAVSAAAQAYGAAMRDLSLAIRDGDDASGALSGRAAGLARAVSSAAVAAGCPEAPSETSDRAEAPTDTAAASVAAAPSVAGSGERAPEGGFSLAAGLPATRADRLVALGPIRLEPASAEGVIRYLPFIALGFCLLFAFRLEDRRGYPRYRCSVKIEVDCGGVRRESRVVDISRAGAKLAADPPPAVGEKVDLTLAGEARRGTVTWSNQAFYGLRFGRLLPETAVDRLRVKPRDLFAPREPTPAPEVAAAAMATQPAPKKPRWYAA